MMISPEGYYEMSLKGKTAEQIMSIIRGLKNEIGHLKNIMEHHDYGSSPIMSPNESTRLWCTREYLEQAKIAYAEAGGIYKPSKAETSACEFQDNIVAISKIIFTIGGYFDGYTTRTITFDSDAVQVSIKHSLAHDLEGMSKDCPYLPDKEEFFCGLERLHIGEWRTSYSPRRFGYEVLDGTQWELEIQYSNGRKPFKSYGSNSYPYNFNEFQELIWIENPIDDDEKE